MGDREEKKERPAGFHTPCLPLPPYCRWDKEPADKNPRPLLIVLSGAVIER